VVVPHSPVKALEYFDDYLRKDPHGFWAPVIRDEIGARQRKEAETLRDAQETVRKRPEDTDALRILAGYYLNLGLYRKSKLAAERLLRVAPNDGGSRVVASVRTILQESDLCLAVQEEFFDKNPEKLKEVEAELGFKLFDGEVTLP
jgi:tetratricopeptide (TPR) repeat protein